MVTLNGVMMTYDVTNMTKYFYPEPSFTRLTNAEIDSSAIASFCCQVSIRVKFLSVSGLVPVLFSAVAHYV